jgi:adenylate kinase family enzyme
VDRTVIIGPPKAGKTTLGRALAGETGVRIRHTDDLIDELDWSSCSERIATEWFAEPGPWIIEGVAAVRALRKWLVANAHGAPCDTIIALSKSRLELTPRQAGMASGCAGIWGSIRGQLRARGVTIDDR